MLLDTALKTSLIVALALGATAMLHRRSAALRHWVLVAGLLAAAGAPALQPIAPGWDLGVLRPPAQPGGSAQVPLRLSDPLSISAADDGPASTPLDIDRVASLTWVAGAAMSLLILVAAMVRLAWMTRRAERITDRAWTSEASHLAHAMGITRPITLLEANRPNLPVTWGVRKPNIILPVAAREWSVQRRRVVLLHELAHIHRGDWLTFVAAEGIRSIYWFNPLIWLASRRLRQESECACDDVVLEGGIDRRTYAEHLLALARLATSRHMLFGRVSPAMACQSSLERRFRAMLDEHRNRRPLSRPVRLATTSAILAAAMAIAGYGVTRASDGSVTAMPNTGQARDITLSSDPPQESLRTVSSPSVTVAAAPRPRANRGPAPAQVFSSFSGSVFDATNGLLPGVRLTLINSATQAEYEVQSDGSGHFEFVGLPSGEYSWQAQLPGFSTTKGHITIAGRNIMQNIDLKLGTVSEVVTIRHSSASAPVRSSADRPIPPNPETRFLPVTSRLPPRTIGGVIRPPTRITDIRPRYPDHLHEAGIGGVVIVEAIIDVNGDVRDVSVRRSPDPDLELETVEAVRQWRFTPTLLNGIPVEIRYFVSATFVTGQ